MTGRASGTDAYPELEPALVAWLSADAPHSAPAELRRRVLAQTALVDQRRRWLRLPWRGEVTRPRLAVAAGAGLAVVLAVGTFAVLLSTRPIESGAMLADPRAMHTATRLADGRVLVAGGTGSREPGAPAPVLASAELWQPERETFVRAGSLEEARWAHTATLLADGRVLVAGGRSQDDETLASAEIFDPVSGSFTPAGSLVEARAGHTATLLADGRVLLLGGERNDWPRRLGLASAEIFDPDTGEFTATGPLGQPRREHATTLLADGRVMVVGGYTDANVTMAGSEPAASVEIWDPATGSFTGAASTLQPRVQHSATTLPDGRVLVVGSGLLLEQTAELWDPASGTFSAVPAAARDRVAHTATLLPDGRVAIIGGGTSMVDLWDPARGTIVPGRSLRTKRWDHTATLVADGRVLVVGGSGGTHPLLVDDQTLGTFELYDPDAPMTPVESAPPAGPAGAFESTGAMTRPRVGLPAVSLTQGRVLVTGPAPSDGCEERTSAEAWDPATGTWQTLQPVARDRVSYTAEALPDGQVLIVGGYISRETAPGSCTNESVTQAVLWDPLEGSTTPAGTLVEHPYGASAALLADGRVLVVGESFVDGAEVVTAHVWDPVSREFEPAGALIEPRSGFTLAALPDGRAIVVGGSGPTQVCDDGTDPYRLCRPDWLATAEVWDPLTSAFSAAGTLDQPRRAHTATALPDGRVLVVGGQYTEVDFGPRADVLSDAEIWDPATGEFSPAGTLAWPRSRHTATLLPDGRVLIVGGSDAAFVEIWDPATGEFEVGPALHEPRLLHSATLLPDGRVLVAGGMLFHPDGTILASAEVYVPSP